MEELKRQFAEHIAEDRRISEQIHSVLRDIKEAQHLVNVNHLPHIEMNIANLSKSFSEMSIAHAKTSADTEWTKKIMFLVLGVLITGVGGVFFSLIQK